MENNQEPLQNDPVENTPNTEVNQIPETDAKPAPSAEVSPEITQTPHPLELTPSATEPKKDNTISIKIKLNKRKIIIAIAIAAVIAALGAIVYSLLGHVVAATVGWSPISRYAVIRELETIYGKNALDSLITKKLIEQEALRQGIAVSEEDINEELENIKKQLAAQGQTLEAILKLEGMTMGDLKKQIIYRKQMEKLADSEVAVEEAEVEQYIKDYGLAIPKGQEITYREQLKKQLKDQKISEAVDKLIKKLRSEATIRYFANY